MTGLVAHRIERLYWYELHGKLFWDRVCHLLLSEEKYIRLLLLKAICDRLSGG